MIRFAHLLLALVVAAKAANPSHHKVSGIPEQHGAHPPGLIKASVAAAKSAMKGLRGGSVSELVDERFAAEPDRELAAQQSEPDGKVADQAAFDGDVAAARSKPDGDAEPDGNVATEFSKPARNLAARKFCAAITSRKVCKNAANKLKCSWSKHKQKCKGKRKACASLASKAKCHKTKYHNFCKWSHKKTKCRKVKCKEIDAKRDCKSSRVTSKKGCEWKNKQCRKKRSVDSGVCVQDF